MKEWAIAAIGTAVVLASFVLGDPYFAYRSSPANDALTFLVGVLVWRVGDRLGEALYAVMHWWWLR